MPNKVVDRMIGRIRAKGRGWVFTPKDFVDLGSRAAVDQTLLRLSSGRISDFSIRRIARGLYDFPRVHPQIGDLSPDPDAVAQAVAQRTGSRLLISPAKAANSLGISTQVPAQLVYLTDGRSKAIRIGNQVIRLKHAAPSKMALAGSQKGLVVQALRALPRGAVTDNVVKQIADALPAKEKQGLARLPQSVSDWARPLAKRISSE